MSAKPKTSREQILAAARILIEQKGLEAVSMQEVADAVGIRTPSLYKRFKDRADLLAAVSKAGGEDLQKVLEAAVIPGKTRKSLTRMASEYRMFAKRHSIPTKASIDSFAAVFRERTGERRAELGAICLTAYVIGFVSSEASGALDGLQVNELFESGLELTIEALLS